MAREILKAALGPGADCLSVEQLGRHMDHALGADEEAAAARHVGGCLHCQAELALLSSFASLTLRADEAEIVRDGVASLERRMSEIVGSVPIEEPLWRRWMPLGGFRGAAAVASVLLVVGAAVGGFYLLTPKAPHLPTTVSTGNEVARSLSVNVRGPVGDQGQAPHRLEWLAVAGAAQYRVRLMEVDRREVWSTSTATTAVDLPADGRAVIVPLKTLLWDVTAYDASGKPIAESGPQSFRLISR